MFLDVGREWHIQETFEGKEAKSQRSIGQGKPCFQEDAHVLNLLP